tara:strand:+ start:943 stop:1167 length:225 start_codon:yes stop_codon:yes gene_type:complete
MTYKEATIFGFDVEYHIEPGQKETWDDPGFPSEIVIDRIYINGVNRYAIDSTFSIDRVNELTDKIQIELEKGNI